MFKEKRQIKKINLEEMKKDQNTSFLEVSTPESLYPQELISFVTGEFARRSNEDQDTIQIAAGEIIANAIDYGNDRNPLKKIEVYCLWREKTFYFAVRDEGEGFAIDNPPFISGKSGIEPEGGYGIKVVKGRVDSVYNFGDSVVYCAVKSK